MINFIKDKLNIEEYYAIHHNISFDYNVSTNHIRRFSKQYKKDLFDFISGKSNNMDKYTNMIKQPSDDVKQFAIQNFNVYKKNIPYINILATDWCNLNCVGCGVAMPLYKLNGVHHEMSLDNLKRLMERYNYLCGDNYTPYFDIVGGEPLLHSDIISFINIVREYNPKSKIVLVTNGLNLYEQPEVFFDCLKLNDVKLEISIYGTTYFYKVNVSEDETIPHNTCEHCTGHLPSYYVKNNFGVLGGIPLLENGDLLYCGFQASQQLNKCFNTNFQLKENVDYVNIYKVNNFDEILRMEQQPHCNFCQYCKPREIVPWRLSSCQKEEWIYE